MSEVYETTKWLKFVIRERKPKTVVVEVINKSDQHLGWIRWYGPWRQYVYEPTRDAPTTFNNTCLLGIVEVLTRLNDVQKQRLIKQNGVPL